MPILITEYQCSKCKQCFKKEEDAINCENSHFEPVSIIEEKTSYPIPIISRYPDSIVVQFADDELIRYCR